MKVIKNSIFYIDSFESGTRADHLPGTKNNLVHKRVIICDQQPNEQQKHQRINKHTNLDTKPLTFWQHLNLLRLRYVTGARLLYLGTILFGAVWFAINAVSITIDYVHYNTLVNLEFKYPNWSNPPAITICSQCILCSYLRNDSDPSAQRIVYFADIFRNDKILTLLDPSHTENYYANSSAVPNIDMKAECVLINDSIANRISESRRYIHRCPKWRLSLQGGDKCFTYFNQISSQTTPSEFRLAFDYQPLLQIRVGGQFLYAPNCGVKMAIHQPEITLGMDDVRMHPLVAGKVLDIRYFKRLTINRPTTQQPACVEYRRTSDANQRKAKISRVKKSLWPDEIEPRVLSTYEDLRAWYFSSASSAWERATIYRSPGECYLYCMWRRLAYGGRSSIRSLNLFADITEELLDRVRVQHDRDARSQLLREKFRKIAENNFTTMSQLSIRFRRNSGAAYAEFHDARRDCRRRCPLACASEEFPEIVTQLYDYGDIDAANAYASISWASAEDEIRTYAERQDLQTFLGMIGGHAHIWLGLSIIAIAVGFGRIIREQRYNHPLKSFQYYCGLARAACGRDSAQFGSQNRRLVESIAATTKARIDEHRDDDDDNRFINIKL